MELLTGILCLLQIANIIFNLRDKLEMPREEKQALSKLLINIGNLIEDVSNDLHKNIYPHAKCLEMEMYAIQLKEILTGKVSDEKINKLSELLNESIRVEKLLGELNNISLEAKDKNIELLQMAASSFRTSGEIILLK